MTCTSTLPLEQGTAPCPLCSTLLWGRIPGRWANHRLLGSCNVSESGLCCHCTLARTSCLELFLFPTLFSSERRLAAAVPKAMSLHSEYLIIVKENPRQIQLPIYKQLTTTNPFKVAWGVICSPGFTPEDGRQCVGWVWPEASRW